MKKLIEKIRAILRNRRIRKIWTRTVSSIACLVVFITTYALVLPAITMESEAACGIEAHQHDESCYEERLICNIPESDGHVHTEDCYSTTQKLICDRSEHLHTSDCYDEEGNLTCSQEEHQHGEDCYEEIRELICGLEESEGHHHDSSCYEKVLTCEKEVHTHSPACYREDAASVAATEHAAIATTTTTSADDAAMDETANAAGTFDPAETAAEGYVPTLDELDFRQLLNDHTTIYYHRPEGSTEDSGQITDWQKVDEDTVLGETDILRVYLAYTIPAGSLNETNATARYRLPGNLHLTDEQMEAINQMENGLSGLYVDYDTLQITDTEKHSAYLGAEAVDGIRTPDQKIEDYLSGNNDAGEGEQTAQEIISAVVKADQVYDEDGVYGKKGAYLGTDLVFTFSPYTILKNRNEYDSEGTPVKAGESVSGWFALDFNMDQVDWDGNAAEITFVSEDNDLNTGLVSVALKKADSTSEETDPASEESPDSNIPDDEKAFNENSSTEENKAEAVEETHPAVSFEDSLTVHTGNLSSDTDAGNLPKSSKMTVSVSAEAGTFPAGTTMVLSAVTDLDAIAEAVEGTVDSKTCGFHAVDISFRDKEGNEIEPLKPISVTMRSDSIKAATEDSSMAPVVVHVEDQSKKTIDAASDLVTTVVETLPSSVDTNDNSEQHGITDSSESISFKADSFSIYAIVYTVDFEYSVNGKMYQFSLPGGGFVSFTDLVEVLGITGDTNSEGNGDESEVEIADNAEENTVNKVGEKNGVNSDTNTPHTLGDAEVSGMTRKFVADVASMEFSSPSLVDVSKVENETTVGQIKECRRLECQYSAELTEQQITEINAQTVEAGDWALISMQPFTSEESLMVTMKNGDVFTIRVTDAQIKKTVIDAKGDTWEITVTYDEDAQIPDGAELQVREILPEDEEYEQYYQQSLERVGVNAPETEDSEVISDASTDDAVEDTVEELTDLIASDNSEETRDESEEPAKRVASDYAHIFNIEIWADDHKVEPVADVTVNIRLLDAPEETEATPQVVHFAKDGAELMDLKESAENSEDKGIQFVTDEFSVYSVVYTVDFSYEINGKVYGFTMQGADSVSLRALIDALHVYEFAAEEKTDVSDFEFQVEAEVTNDDLAEQDDSGNADLDSFMGDIKNVTFSNDQLLVPAKVEEDTTVGKIKTDLNLFPTYPLGLKQSEVLELNAKEYTAGDWVLISMKAFDTMETLTITMNTGESFNILVTDAQDAVMNGDVVQTISNPAGTTIDLFDYWIVSQDLVGRDGWGDLNQGQGAAEAGDDKPLNGTGNNKGINSSTTDTEHGHALKFNPAWSGTVYNGNKIGTTGNAWQSVNLDMRDGLNSYTGDEYTWHYNCPKPFTGIVQNNLSNGYPILTNNQDIGTNGESLAYLFDPSVAHEGKASYDSVNQLLYVDKDGYYTYDSRDYAASFDTENKTFTLTEQTSTNSEVRGFWPFGTQNFWTGMHVNTQFSMPAGGQVLNPSGVLKPMQFEFSGDDDVWIYVDGILIGDAGGIHNRTEVDINFQTGIVSISLQEDKYLDDLFRTGLRDQGKTESEIEEYIANNFDGHTFKVNSYHSFDFFYLERGGGESNLYIHYNLVSTADFTAHKSYYGADEEDILTRDQFKFELIGLDGKYRLNGNNELVQEDATSDAVMPHASGSGEGTVASPHYEDNVTTTLSSGTVNSQIYITGVSEDGNVNFGTAIISQTDMNEADQGNPPVYKYIIREIVPDDAVNQDGIIWSEATDAQKAAGGFVKDQVTYDGTVYYMTGQVTSWTETNASGQEIIRHGISKTYYTDDTYTTVKSDVNFASFENRFTPDFGNVDFKKVDGAGEPLAGAVFTLYKDEACTIPATDLDTEGHPVWTGTSDSDGKVSFGNVRVGTYYMKETKAPSEYALDETVYKVVIEDSKDNAKKSKITILGDEEETAVTEIANAKAGKITVIKKWLNASGTEIDGGSNLATVWLKRKHMVAEESSIGSHIVTVTMKAENAGEHAGEPVVQTVSGDTVIIEWDDEWQGNFNWWLTIGNRAYEGWISAANEDASGDGYIIHQLGEKRRLTITNVRDDEEISFTVKHWQTWIYSDDHWTNFTHPTITGSSAEPNYAAAEDTAFNNEKHTRVLSGSTWSHTWNIGGTESSHDGFDYSAMDDNGKNYLYYVVELDAQGNAIEVGGSPLEGYVLQGYSANNNTGVSNQGVITIYNRAEGSDAINVVIKKTDNVENSTNYLDGAVFKMMYRSDSSSTFTNVSNESVPELDSDSQFTVPTAGIILTGLVDGQYLLQEISPPSGYVITNSTPVTFTVSGGTITSTEGTITGVRYTAATETSNAEFIVPNPPGAALPNTGGPGTRLFTILGSILILGARVLLWRRGRFI